MKNIIKGYTYRDTKNGQILYINNIRPSRIFEGEIQYGYDLVYIDPDQIDFGLRYFSHGSAKHSYLEGPLELMETPLYKALQGE